MHSSDRFRDQNASRTVHGSLSDIEQQETWTATRGSAGRDRNRSDLMLERWIGVVVAPDKVTAVDAEVPESGPLVIQADHSWPLQKGHRASGYKVLHQQLAD